MNINQLQAEYEALYKAMLLADPFDASRKAKHLAKLLRKPFDFKTTNWSAKHVAWMNAGRFCEKQKPGLQAEILVFLGSTRDATTTTKPILRFCTDESKPINLDMFVEFVGQDAAVKIFSNVAKQEKFCDDANEAFAWQSGEFHVVLIFDKAKFSPGEVESRLAAYKEQLGAKLPDGPEHPWIVAWKKWAETEAPETGHGEDLPFAEIIISLTKPASAILALKAQNGAHIGMKHFVKLVGCEVAANIWQKAEKHQVQGMVEGEMELWEMEGDDYQVMFAITPEQFHPTIGVREAVSSFFQSQCVMARLSSLASKARGSAD